jgi:transcription initiation factor TFIID subunit 10
VPVPGAPGAPGEKGADKSDKGKNANLGVQRAGFGGGGSGSGRTILTLEDLGMAVGEYGVAVRRGEFYR